MPLAMAVTAALMVGKSALREAPTVNVPCMPLTTVVLATLAALRSVVLPEMVMPCRAALMVFCWRAEEAMSYTTHSLYVPGRVMP